MDPVFADPRWTSYGLFREAARAVDAAIAATVAADAPEGLDADVGSVLLQLVRTPDERLRMTDLARAMALHPSHITRLVDRCERLGWVERIRCEADRRVWWASLTDAGRDVIGSVAPTMLAALDTSYFDHLSHKEVVALEEATRRLRDAAQGCDEATT